MKNNKLIIPILISALMLTACGASKNDAASISGESYNYISDSKGTQGAMMNGGAVETAPAYDSWDGAMADNDYAYEVAEESAAMAQNPADRENNTSTDVVKKEMLVYSCNMSVDVLDFDTAISSFRTSLNNFGAFVETENYSDGGNSNRWYNAEAQKWQTYTANVRVPSNDYERFCNTVAELGDLRSKNANVQNLSTEYYDLAATLEIYEAKQTRYTELLSTIMDDQYAIAVEEELTNIQIEISKIKTRMKTIQTDVAYSYVYVTINEVKEYTPEPVKTDTFFQRLGNTISDATESFLDFAETVLFILIYLFPHIIIIGLIVFGIIKFRKSRKKKKAAKKAAEGNAETAPEAVPAKADEAEKPTEEPKENKNNKKK